MHFRITTVLGLLILPALCFAAGTDVPRLIDDDGPAEGVVPLELNELWRVGGDDEDILFGRITDVLMHEDGTVYVLDNQLCQVVVLSKDGEHLRDLSRQGDGPGELRQPMGLIFLGDGRLGVGMGFPGKIVTLDLDGTPGPSLFPIGVPAEGNVGVMISLQRVDGLMGATGGRLAFGGEGPNHTKRFLSVSTDEPGEYRRILERETPLDVTGHGFVEHGDYYIDRSWVMGTGGRIYAPLTRDVYEVSVVDPSGTTLLVFGREEKPRKRTQAEKDEVSPMIDFAGVSSSDQWEICDHDASISRLLFDPDTETVWVLTPHGDNDQPEGILQSWDVFSPEGEYLRRVPVPLGDAMNDGTLHLVGNGRLIVVRGTGSAIHADEDDADEEIEPLEVICYEIR